MTVWDQLGGMIAAATALADDNTTLRLINARPSHHQTRPMFRQPASNLDRTVGAYLAQCVGRYGTTASTEGDNITSSVVQD